MDSFQPLPPGASLAPTYYLDNFCRFLTDVVTRYHRLLSPAELAFHDSFMRLSDPARCLYVRLVSRKGPLFRRDKLSYPEIPDLDAAISELAAAHMLFVNPAVRLLDLLAIFTRTELLVQATAQSWCPPTPKTLRRPELLQLLCTGLQDQGDISERWYGCLRLEEPILQPAHCDVLERLRLLFFGHLGQDLTEFVLADLGLVQYEPYPLEGNAAAFKSRWELDELLLAIQIRSQVETFLDVAQEVLLEAALEANPEINPPTTAETNTEVNTEANTAGSHAIPHPAHVANLVFPQGALNAEQFSAFVPAQRQIAKAYNRLGRALERQGCLEQAANFYRLSDQPPARERLARVLCAQQDYQAAISLCDAILDSPWSEHERTCALRIRQRCLRQLGRGQSTSKPRPIRIQHLQLTPPSNTALSVERRALEHLIQTRQIEGAYVENWLFNALFGLLFWDIIYAPVEDAFYHPFQRGPRDLYEPEFYSKRASLIEHRLGKLQRGEGLRLQLAEVWQQKFGISNPFVFWSNDMLPLLEQAADRIPAQQLIAVFRRMLADLRNHCSGFPDLILFDGAGRFELIEVKGPGDRLQDHQRRWLEFFEEQGIPASVLNVSYSTECPLIPPSVTGQ